MRLTTLSLVLLASVSVAACSHTWTPPDITYDAAATPQPAVLEAEPPKAVEIVEIPTPLPLPGQLQRIPEARPQPPEPADPRARIEAANSAARVQPSRSGYFNAVQVYP
ncbi:MAG TPA: P-type conjugative transfer protein TrbG, partial [Caulobacter sp.]|nr:P-type conjugative transfer protein TrbG [Caulobacter sp.]